MRRRSRAIAVMGGVILAVTAALAALLIRDWSGLTGWALGAVLWTELVWFGGALLVERYAGRTEPVFLRAGLYPLLTLYAGVNLPVSLLFLALFKTWYRPFLVVELLLTAALLLGIVPVVTAARGVHGEKIGEKFSEGESE